MELKRKRMSIKKSKGNIKPVKPVKAEMKGKMKAKMTGKKY